eukprot:GILI01007846.1.p1 GENE.GILI01007846.1~~GILI01007846.1.p1  ORF type:complete len:421 (+),score=138.84 GILI01007846.1:86-1264(+)
MDLLAKLVSPTENRSAAIFCAVFCSLSNPEVYKNMRFDKHICAKGGARKAAVELLRLLQRERCDPLEVIIEDVAAREKYLTLAQSAELDSFSESVPQKDGKGKGFKSSFLKVFEGRLRRRSTRDELCSKNIIKEEPIPALTSTSTSAPNSGRKDKWADVKEKISNFFRGRPRREELVEKKIIKDPLVFGVLLEKLQERTGREVPPLVEHAIAYLEKNAMDLEGVFRLPGSTAQVQALKQQYDDGEEPDLNEILDAHTITSLLKLFFREMPEPLFPFDMYPTFIQAQQLKDDTQRYQAVVVTVGSLPRLHYVLLRTLCRFLHRLSLCSKVTKMGVPNLALVFAPNLLRPRIETYAQIVTDAPLVQGLLQLLIEREVEIFGYLDDYFAQQPPSQ